MFPTPYTVTRSRPTTASTDAHGNAVRAYTSTLLPVHGWAATSSEPNEANRAAVVWDLEVYAPPATDVLPSDRVTVEGAVFDVVGHPADYTHGPFAFAGGVVIRLRRAEG